MQLIISGIGTDVGKTVVSAIIAQALDAAYWKPVQAGDLSWSDSMKVAHFTKNRLTILPERHRLTAPMSPHAASALDGVQIHAEDFVLPDTDGNLLIEGAGGLMVPVNAEGLLYIDLFQRWNLPVVLVSKHYLGSINHTLLSVEALRTRQIPILGIVFVGEEQPTSEEMIERSTGVPTITRIPWVNELTHEFILEQAENVKKWFQK
jgi:dethiobiotin synthetase